MADNNEKERKERVIHTRIPESLDDEIRQRASNLGMSVSNLVRNALKNAFGLVEDAIADSATVARTAVDAVDPTTIPPLGGTGDNVLGWQPIVLNLNAVCGECNAILPKGTEAALGLTAGASTHQSILCTPCLDAIRTGGAEKKE